MVLQSKEPEGIAYPERKKLETFTVQVLVFHWDDPGQVLWVKDKGDLEPSNNPDLVHFYKDPNTKKPPSWSMPGGSREIEKHETVEETARRELADETGLRDFVITPLNDSRLELLRYEFGSGHRIFLVRADAFSNEFGPIVESNEVERVQWFDLRESLVSIFRDLEHMEYLPFSSHLKRMMLGTRVIDLENRLARNRKAPLSWMIHPSWKILLPQGMRDARFPKKGFRIPPHEKFCERNWYTFFPHLIGRGIEDPDLDVIYEYFKPEVDRAREAEEELEKIADSIPEIPSAFGESLRTLEQQYASLITKKGDAWENTADERQDPQEDEEEAELAELERRYANLVIHVTHRGSLEYEEDKLWLQWWEEDQTSAEEQTVRELDF